MTVPQISRGAVILMYHRIASLRHDVHRLAVPPDEFRVQLDHLCRHWQPMTLTALAEAVRDGEPPEGAVALTFDDGYLDNLESAARILAEFQVPATFFLTSECLNQHRTFWWDTLERILLATDYLPSELTLLIGGERHTFNTADTTERRAAHHFLCMQLRRSLPAVRDSLVRQLSAIGGDRASPLDRPMTADEIRSLAAFPLIDVGAHGVHHVALPGLTPEQLHHEIFECRSELEQLIGRSITLFAYPYGAMSAEAVEMVRAAGYVFAVGCEPRSLRRREHLYQLPRIAAPHNGGGFVEWLSQHSRLGDSTD